MPRYWVGGAGTWDGSDTTHWSDISNGSGGFSVPTNTDDVYFDANSGTGTYTVTVASGNRPCNNFNTTGFTGEITGSNANSTIQVNGDAVLGVSGTFAPVNLPIVSFVSNNKAHNITSNGQSWGRVTFTGNANSSFTLLDDFLAFNTDGAPVTLNAGTLNGNGKNFTCRRFITGTATSKVINMGSGTWSVTGGMDPNTSTGEPNVWDVRTGPLTLNAGTSTLLFGSAAGVDRYFYTGGYTYNKVQIGAANGAGGTLNIYGGGTLAELSSVKLAPSTVRFDDTVATTVTLFSACGSYDNADWQGTLVSSIDDTQTTGILTNNTNSNFPTSGTVKIGNEVISYTGITAVGLNRELTGVVRGVNGTDQDYHTAGDIVYCAFYLSVNSISGTSQASINTNTSTGIFYAGRDSVNAGNNTGINFTDTKLIDYLIIQYLNVTTTRTIFPGVGYTGVANQIQTTPGNALGVVGNANNGLGNALGGSGLVDIYTGVS